MRPRFWLGRRVGPWFAGMSVGRRYQQPRLSPRHLYRHSVPGALWISLGVAFLLGVLATYWALTLIVLLVGGGAIAIAYGVRHRA